MSAVRERNALVIVGTPIGNLGDLSPRAADAFRAADVILAEDTRRTRALLTHAGIAAGGRLRAVNAHNERDAAPRVIDEIRGGARVAYATDAGMPGISDPGAALVRACVDAGIAVEVVPGPSALLAALVVSGLPTEPFVFEGFLPRKGSDRTARLERLAREPRTVILFEAPHRLGRTLGDLESVCGNEREVVLARELTKRFEEVWRGTTGEAITHVEDSPPRGEYVIVLGGSADRTVSEADIDGAVTRALAEGSSTRDAAAAVAASLGIPKRRAYEAATRLATDGDRERRRAPRS
jgi:16S rRNA (cytidine1402-2'-O)-methyltransferase